VDQARTKLSKSGSRTRAPQGIIERQNIVYAQPGETLVIIKSSADTRLHICYPDTNAPANDRDDDGYTGSADDRITYPHKNSPVARNRPAGSTGVHSG